MTGPSAADILRHLAVETATDRELLQRFATTRDGEAFAELVRRHGPVVLAACRRGVRHHHDADDAFQAVFLVLARRAGTIQRPELLGSWLYKVAVGVARNARRAAARRREREVQGVDVPEPVARPTPALDDFGPVLDEELEKLPAWHREALVLCDLRGVSRAEAAAALGVPLGTVDSRLATGRKKLAARLARRGVTMSVGAVMVEGRAAAVPEGLMSRTCEVVAVWSSGGAVPGVILRLVSGGAPVKTLLLSGVLALTLVAGVGYAPGGGDHGATPRPLGAPATAVSAVQDESDAKKGLKNAEVPAAKIGTPRLIQKGNLLRGKHRVQMAWSPNGTRMAICGQATGQPRPGVAGHEAEWAEVHIIKVGEPFEPLISARVPDGGRLAGFTDDGTSLLTHTTEFERIGRSDTLNVWTVANRIPGEVVGRLVPRKTGAVFDLPDRAARFVVIGHEVRFLAPNEYGPDGFTRVDVCGLDIRTGAGLGPFGVVVGKFREASLSPDGSRAAMITTAGKVEVYSGDGKRAWAADPRPMEVTGSRLGLTYHCLAYSKDGSVLLAGRPGSLPSAFVAENGRLLPTFEGLEMVGQWGWAAALSADGRLAAVSHGPFVDLVKGAGNQPGRRLTVWDTRTGRQVWSWEGSASALAFHPTRPVLAVLEPHGSGTRLGLWDFAAQP